MPIRLWKGSVSDPEPPPVVMVRVQYLGNGAAGFYVDEIPVGSTYTIKSRAQTGIQQHPFSPNLEILSWNTISDGSGTPYLIGAQITAGDWEGTNLTLFAQWGMV